jgi:hypothetical protein
LALNVDKYSNLIDFELALSVAKYFEYSNSQAKDIISEMKNTVGNNWRKLAEKYKLNRFAIENMSPAFAEF